MKTILNFERLVFLLSCWVLLFWLLTLYLIDVYAYPVVGAVYEMLWIFMVGLVFILPVIAVIQFIGRKAHLRSFGFYSIVVNAVLISMIFFSGNSN